MRRCVGMLTELQRQSVLMAYCQGQTYQEIGRTLNVAPPTINVRLRDCLANTAES